MRRRTRLAALPVHRHSLPQIAVDAGLVALAYFLAYRLRFDGGVPSDYQQLFEHTLSFVVIGSVRSSRASGSTGTGCATRRSASTCASCRPSSRRCSRSSRYVAVVKPKEIFVGYPRGFVSVSIPTGVLVLYGLLALVFLGAVRYAVHLYFERPVGGYRARRGARSVLIVGAGDGGRLLLREILRNPDLDMRPVGFVDDDPRKQGVRVDRGLDVLGTTEELGYVLDDVEPDEVLIAIPSAPGTLRARVVRACRERGVRVKTMPTVFELLQTGGGRYIKQVREVRVEDVLGREPVRMEIEATGGYLTGRCVMVTGAGGSIGAELSRQIARVGPSRLVLLDHAEDNLFEITRELVEDRHALNTVAVLADCKEEERMREVFREHRPTVVFHAAAYKHVGLMEDNPVEAVRNNAIATRVMARVAGDTGTKVFVQVSTDKAVDPATVMGASKALAEWAAEAANARYEDTAYTSVRFGNVLNSSGSVVPIFRRQIEAGGPVTVTDPDMTRFFMTIPEAVQLVIRAGSLAQGGEVFVLEMGEPVRIIDLAEDMIRFSGLEPGRDIAIEIVGRAAGREAARGPVQRLRAPGADAGAEDPARAPARRRSGVGRGDLRPHRPAGARGRRGGAGGHRLGARDGPRGRPGARAGADRGGRDRARRGRRAAWQPHGLLDSLAARPWSISSRSRCRTRSRSTAPTSASRRSSAWPCSRSSTSRRRASCAACAIGPAARPSARRRSRPARWRRPRPRAASRRCRSRTAGRPPPAAATAAAAAAAGAPRAPATASRRPRWSSRPRAAPRPATARRRPPRRPARASSPRPAARRRQRRTPAERRRCGEGRRRREPLRRVPRAAAKKDGEAEAVAADGEPARPSSRPRPSRADAERASPRGCEAERRGRGREAEERRRRRGAEAEKPADAAAQPGGDAKQPEAGRREARRRRRGARRRRRQPPPEPEPSGRREGDPMPNADDDERLRGDPRSRPSRARRRSRAAAPRPPPRCASPAARPPPAAPARAGRRSPQPRHARERDPAAARSSCPRWSAPACWCSWSSRCSSRASSAAAAGEPVAHAEHDEQRHARGHPSSPSALTPAVHQGGRAQRHHDPRPGLAARRTRSPRRASARSRRATTRISSAPTPP